MPDGISFIGWAPPDVGLDRKQPPDALERLVRQCSGQSVLPLVDVPELAARVAPAGRLDVAALLVQSVVAGEGVGHQDAAPVADVPLRMLAFAVGRVLQPHGWG